MSNPPPVEPPVHAHICPFCGLTREVNEEFDGDSPCPRCTLADTPTTRNATKARIGPWHVRQVRNPWAPGMRFDTLVALINRGQVNKDSVVRGPTTFQLWRRASEIKGLSREFGVCYSCGGEIERTANLCPHCNRLQEPPVNPDVLVETREPTAPGTAATPSPASSQPSSTSVAPQPLPRPQQQTAKPPFGSEPQGQRQAAKQELHPPEIEPPEIEIASMPMSSDPMEMLGVTDDQVKNATQPAARAPLRDRPTPIRPRTPGSEDALLTPQELAAAFQLDFSTDGILRRPRSKRFIAFVMLLLLAAIAGGVMYVRPELREQATSWCTETVASIKSFFASRTAPTKPATTLPSGVSSGRGEHSTAPRPEAITITPTAPKKPAVLPEFPAKTSDTPTPTPVSAPTPPKVEIGGPADAAKPAGDSAAPAEPAKVEVPKPPAVPALSPDPYVRSKQLWSRAIDAEANQDYVEAVSCYEQIKKLPADVHPPGLDVRLELARKLK